MSLSSALPRLSAFASAWLGLALGSTCSAEMIRETGTALTIEGPAAATVFEVAEYTLGFEKPLASFATLPDDQVNDAYDADRDGVFMRVTGIFTAVKDPRVELRIPGFAMRDESGGPWRWRLRWSPNREGPWRLRVTVEGRSRGDAQPVKIEQLLGQQLAAAVRADADGPLVAPGAGENPGCLRELRADGRSRATWLFGACRAWVVESDPKGLAWEPFEGIDRARDLFPVLRANGYNLLNQWMAPWEYLLVHRDRGEQWRSDDGRWHRHALPAEAAWTPWACYDQGRAKAFDGLVRQCEGNAGESTVRMLLAPLPHQCLEMHGGVWGGDEDPPTDTAGHLAAAKRCGFSVFKPGMSAWDFFAADAQAPRDDWRSRLFDAQANYYRYVIARWSASRAIGLWVLMDEIDAVGDAIGVKSRPSGWYAHPDCDRWLTRIADLFGGRIVGADGQRYDGDPYRHPLHAASTSFGGDFQPGANLEWTWSPPDGQARPEVVGWHWYPHWPADSTYDDAWRYVVDGILAFASSPDPSGHPKLISEFGGIDRASPEDEPTPLYPTLYHMAVWATIFAGQAGTAMDWDDGKEFGELRWRVSSGVFDHEHYPVDNAGQVKALRAVLERLGADAADRLHPCTASSHLRIAAPKQGRVFALASVQAPDELHGWALTAHGGEAVVSGLAPGSYRLSFDDPWSGLAILPCSRRLTVAADGVAVIDLAPALASMRPTQAFPGQGRLDRGKDVAFHLVAVSAQVGP